MASEIEKTGTEKVAPKREMKDKRKSHGVIPVCYVWTFKNEYSS